MDWILLPQPPAPDIDDDEQQEHQKVQIEFQTLESEPRAHRFVIHRDSTGSYEVLDNLQLEETVEIPVSWRWEMVSVWWMALSCKL